MTVCRCYGELGHGVGCCDVLCAVLFLKCLVECDFGVERQLVEWSWMGEMS